MPQTAKAQATAERISRAASALFTQQGYQSTTIGHVAEAAGVAPGTVMLHFGSKSQLATAAFADHIAEVVEAARRTERGDHFDDDLRRFVTPIYAWYRDSQSFAPDLLREALFSDGPWSDHYARTVARTVDVFNELVVRHATGDAVDQHAGERLLGAYLLVLFQGFRGAFESVDAQVTRFIAISKAEVSW